MLALPAIPSGYSGEFVGVWSTIRLRHEQAGWAFFRRFEERKGGVLLSEESSSSVNEEEEVVTAAGLGPRKRKTYKGSALISSRVRKAINDKVDLYALCQVPRTATSDEIKKQFRKLALVYHPDKHATGTPSPLPSVTPTPTLTTGVASSGTAAGAVPVVESCSSVENTAPGSCGVVGGNSCPTGAAGAAASSSSSSSCSLPVGPDASGMSSDDKHAHFLQVHNAFEILMDEVSRRQYDGSCMGSFDERLPEDFEFAEATRRDPVNGFYTLCGPAFAKEQRWVKQRPIPELGDAESEFEAVRKFYQFWLTYESTRDFSNAGEYQHEDSQDRDEKKWMQRENWKVVKALEKAERQRVINFVKIAEARDPRLARERELLGKQRVAAQKAKMTPAQLKAFESEQAAKNAKAKAKAQATNRIAMIERRRKLMQAAATCDQIYRTHLVEGGHDTPALKAIVENIAKNCEDPLAYHDLARKLQAVAKRNKIMDSDAVDEAVSLLQKFKV